MSVRVRERECRKPSKGNWPQVFTPTTGPLSQRKRPSPSLLYLICVPLQEDVVRLHPDLPAHRCFDKKQSRRPLPPKCSLQLPLPAAIAAPPPAKMCHVSRSADAQIHHTAEACNFALLELAANDDLQGLKRAMEEQGAQASACANWYCRQIASNKMASVERNPIMIAALFGSMQVLPYLLDQLAHNGGDVNRLCGADRASALHCALVSGTPNMPEVVHLLLKYGADPSLVSPTGLCSLDPKLNLQLPHRIATQEAATTPARRSAIGQGHSSPELEAPFNHKVLLPDSVSETSYEDLEESMKSLQDARAVVVAKPLNFSTCSASVEQNGALQDPVHDVLSSEVKNAIYSTDEFRMYSFKVRPCSRAYSHDWTECPFAHPGENARRRDPRRFHYSCVPCPDFRKGACKQGDACEYAHGVFESWLHPAQYRTRLCKDGTSCARKVCFFAHTKEEVRPLYLSAECGGGSSPSPCASPSSVKAAAGLLSGGMNLGTPSPSLMGCTWTQPGLPALCLPEGIAHSRKLRASLSARDIALDRDLVSLSAQARINAAVASSNSFAISPARDRKLQCFGPSLSNLDDSMFGVVSPRSPLQVGTQAPAWMGSKFPDSSIGDGALEEMIAVLASSGGNAGHSRSLQGQYDDCGHTGILGPPAYAGRMASPSPPQSYSAEGGFLQKRSKETSVCSSPASRQEKAWLDWGSPTGKAEWGVSGDDLARFRKAYSCKA